MDYFSSVKSSSSKTKRKRGAAMIRCTGNHAKLIEARVKNFSLRFNDPLLASFEPGKFLTIIKYEGRFQNQITIAKNEVLIKSVVPFYLDMYSMMVGQSKRVLTGKERYELAIRDGFSCWTEMATYYLSRRTAYHSASPQRQRKDFEGIMITWEWRPDLADEVFETKGRSERKPSIPRKEWLRLQQEAGMVA